MSANSYAAGLEVEYAVNGGLLLLILLSAIAAKALHGVSGTLCQWVVGMMSPLSEEVIKLRGELSVLREAQREDNFAEHAKLQRKINQKESQLHTLDAKHKSSTWKQRAILLGATFLLIEGVRIAIVVVNRQTPVVRLPPETFWPLTTILSFPTGVEGALGPPLWALICRQTLEALWTLMGR